MFLTEAKNSLEDWKEAIKDGYSSFGYCENSLVQSLAEFTNDDICEGNSASELTPPNSMADSSTQYFLSLESEHIENLILENLDYTNTYNNLFQDAKFIGIHNCGNIFFQNWTIHESLLLNNFITIAIDNHNPDVYEIILGKLVMEKVEVYVGFFTISGASNHEVEIKKVTLKKLLLF